MNWWFFTRQKVFTRKVSSDSGVGVLDSATRCRGYWNNHFSDAFGFFSFRVNCWFFANGLLFKPKIFLRFILFMAWCSIFKRKKAKNKAASFAKKKMTKTINYDSEAAHSLSFLEFEFGSVGFGVKNGKAAHELKAQTAGAYPGSLAWSMPITVATPPWTGY